MRRLKEDKLRLACLLLAALLVVSGVWLLNNRGTYVSPRSQIVSDYMSGLEHEMSFGGVLAVKQYYMDNAGEWLGNSNGNLIVFNREGDVFASLNDNFLDENGEIHLLTPRYYLYRLNDYGNSDSVGVALMVDEKGTVVRPLRLMGDSAMCGQDNPLYDTYFPVLNETLYYGCAIYTQYDVNEKFWPVNAEAMSAGGSDTRATPIESAPESAPTVQPDAGWMYNPDVREALEKGATQADVETVERYCAWEIDALNQAGEFCAKLVADERNELFALAIYENNAQTNAEHIHALSLWRLFGALFPYWLIGVAIWIIMLAFWVLRDARKRDFMPALWGILTLLGNVVTLIVYLIIRPKETGCPQCGAATRRDYVACPICGASLRERCHNCGRALEEAWSYCPYCGRPRETESAEPESPGAGE